MPRQAMSAAVAASAGGSKTVLVPVGNGSEEIEAVTIIDVLRRAGADVTVASVEDTLQVDCSRGVKLVADVSISDLADQEFDCIACPGGMPGAERLRDSPALQRLLRAQSSSGRLVTAMCAAPAVVLESQGFLKGVTATAHPAFIDQVSNSSEDRVVADGTVITSRGPGTAIEFALALVKALCGADKAAEVAGPMVVHDGMKY